MDLKINRASRGRSIIREMSPATRAIRSGAELSTKRVCRFFARLVIAGVIAGALADLGNLAVAQNNYAAAHTLYREKPENFPGTGTETRRRPSAGMLRVPRGNTISSGAFVAFGGNRGRTAKNIGSPLTPAEQAKLESTLQVAWQSLTNAAGATAWLEGWAMPAEKSVEAALMNETTAALD